MYIFHLYQIHIIFVFISDCPAGTRIADNGVGCTDCPVNTYQPESNQTECIPCPTGQKTSGTRSTQCVSKCTAGSEFIRGHCLSSHSNKITWPEAKTDCTRRGGHLINIQDVTKWNQVKGVCTNLMLLIRYFKSDDVVSINILQYPICCLSL